MVVEATNPQATPAPKQSEAELARLRKRVNEHAETVLQEKFQGSQLSDLSPNLPQFSLDEVVKGKSLGKGFFGVVYEIKGLDGRDPQGKLIRASSTRKPAPPVRGKWFISRRKEGNFEESEDDDLPHFYESDSELEDHPPPTAKAAARKQEAARSFMREHCQRAAGQARYAMKILRPNILEDPMKLYFQGVMDMQSEARLLSNTQHPHIVKLRAIARGQQDARCHEEYFLVLDRLYDVLENRIKVWERKFKRNSGMVGRLVLDRMGRKLASLWQDRIVAGHDLASALAYLHSRRIIHRDLKSDNIGFDIRNDIKIFDFGLARELPPADQANADGAWKMTGSTGTPRYMSPEVALDRPYNESSDSYSFCMLLWEILALKTPFELYSMKSFQARVWQDPHKRPPLDPTWPRSLHLVLNRGWSPVLNERQSMTAVAEVLRQEVIKCRDDADQEWGLNVGAERRSTHVFDENDFKNIDFSQKSFFSILSSPFHSKSPFRVGGKPPVSPAKKASMPLSPPTSQEDKIKLPVDLSTCPTQLDISGSNCSSPRPRVASLPSRPPLMFDDDECEDAKELPTLPQVEEEMETKLQPCLSATAATTGHDGSAAIWRRIQEAKASQERIRMRLSAKQMVQ